MTQETQLIAIEDTWSPRADLCLHSPSHITADRILTQFNSLPQHQCCIQILNPTASKQMTEHQHTTPCSGRREMTRRVRMENCRTDKISQQSYHWLLDDSYHTTDWVLRSLSQMTLLALIATPWVLKTFPEHVSYYLSWYEKGSWTLMLPTLVTCLSLRLLLLCWAIIIIHNRLCICISITLCTMLMWLLYCLRYISSDCPYSFYRVYTTAVAAPCRGGHVWYMFVTYTNNAKCIYT